MAMQPPASGSYDYGVDILYIVEEAFSRCGLMEDTLSAEQVISARRSLNLMMLNRAADYINLWTVKQVVLSLTDGGGTVNLPEGAIDVIEANVRGTGSSTTGEVPLDIWGRQEWMNTTFPDQESHRPSRIWVDRQLTTSGVSGAPTATPVHVWPVCDNDDHELVLNVMFYPEKVDSLVDGIGVPPLFIEAVISELARRLSLKYAPDRYNVLKSEEMEMVRQAKMGASENTNVSFDFG